MSNRASLILFDNASPKAHLLNVSHTGAVVLQDVGIGSEDRWGFLAKASEVTGTCTFAAVLIAPDGTNLGACIPDDVNSNSKISLPNLTLTTLAAYKIFDRPISGIGTIAAGKTAQFKIRLTITPGTSVTLSHLFFAPITFGQR